MQLAWRMAALICSLAIICYYTADDVYAADQDNCESTGFDMNISSPVDASASDEPSKPDMERINKILVNSGLSKKTEGKRYIVCYEYISYVSGICVVLENPGYFTIYNIDRTSHKIHYEFDVPMNCEIFSWAFNSLPKEAKDHSRRKKPWVYNQLWSPMTVFDKNSQPIYTVYFGLEEYDDSKFKDRLYKLAPVLWWLTMPISFHKLLVTPPELIFEGGSQSFRDGPEFQNLCEP